MKDLLLMFAHLLATLAKLLGPGGAKAIVADSLLMKQQLLIVNRCPGPANLSTHRPEHRILFRWRLLYRSRK
jgi:hypothetical protein